MYAWKHLPSFHKICCTRRSINVGTCCLANGMDAWDRSENIENLNITASAPNTRKVEKLPKNDDEDWSSHDINAGSSSMNQNGLLANNRVHKCRIISQTCSHSELLSNKTRILVSLFLRHNPLIADTLRLLSAAMLLVFPLHFVVWNLSLRN